MTFRRTYDTKHESPEPMCFREVKVALPCSRFRLDSRQSSLFSGAPYLFYGSGSTVSRYVASIMRWQGSLLATFLVGYCFLQRQILARCNVSRELILATLH